MWGFLVTWFLEKYVMFPISAYDSIGDLKDDYIKEGFSKLISDDVFTKEELVSKLFKDYDVFVPMNYFE